MWIVMPFAHNPLDTTGAVLGAIQPVMLAPFHKWVAFEGDAVVFVGKQRPNNGGFSSGRCKIKHVVSSGRLPGTPLAQWWRSCRRYLRFTERPSSGQNPPVQPTIVDSNCYCKPLLHKTRCITIDCQHEEFAPEHQLPSSLCWIMEAFFFEDAGDNFAKRVVVIGTVDSW